MKRKSLLKALGGLSVACLAGAFAFFPAETVATKAETEETPVAVENVAMAYGAAVRISTDSTQGNYAGKSGLRFTMYIDQDTYNTAVETYGEDKVEVGMYYVGKNIKVGETVDETTDAEMQNIATIPASARHAVMEAYIDASAKTVEPSYAFNVAQLDIPESGYNVQLIANGYIKTIDSEGNEDYTWATNPQTRSVAQVASIGISKGNTHSDLHNFVNAVATEDTFQFENTAFDTDMYKQAELNVNATVPAHLQVVWESDNEEVATVDETGKITKVGKGTANVTAKIGNNVRTASVTIGDPIALKVQSEADADKFNQTNVSYLSASDMVDLEGYDGNALKITQTGNWIYNLYSDYSVAELEEIAKIYNTVTFKFAIDNVVDNPDNTSNGYCALQAIDNSTASVASKYYGGTHSYTADSTVWEEWSLSIVDYISLIQTEAETGKLYLPLFKIYCTGLSVRPDIYLGNIEFYLNPYIVKVVDGSQTANFCNPDKTPTYVDAPVLNGDYTGSAVKYMGVGTNQRYRVYTGLTLEQLNALSEKYENVSMWVAVDNLASGAVSFGKNWAKGENNVVIPSFINKANGGDFEFTSENTNTWVKFTMSVETFISICTTTTTDEETGETATTVNEYFALFAVDPTYSSDKNIVATEDKNADSKLDSNDIGIYVGDIFFE